MTTDPKALVAELPQLIAMLRGGFGRDAGRLAQVAHYHAIFAAVLTKAKGAT